MELGFPLSFVCRRQTNRYPKYVEEQDIWFPQGYVAFAERCKELARNGFPVDYTEHADKITLTMTYKFDNFDEYLEKQNTSLATQDGMNMAYTFILT